MLDEILKETLEFTTEYTNTKYTKKTIHLMMMLYMGLGPVRIIKMT